VVILFLGLVKKGFEGLLGEKVEVAQENFM